MGQRICGLYGIRRDRETTIYEIRVIAELITDIINYFGRSFVISGAVWEHFGPARKEQNPFIRAISKSGESSSSELDHMQGLLKETKLDVVNGIHGKTVIHPTHLKPVQSMYVVTKEEYMDALSILEHADGTVGVMKSTFSNKMNETKPHYRWAENILMKSDIYGCFMKIEAISTYSQNQKPHTLNILEHMEVELNLKGVRFSLKRTSFDMAARVNKKRAFYLLVRCSGNICLFTR